MASRPATWFSEPILTVRIDGLARLPEEPHQHHLFLQRLEHFPQPLAEIERGQVRGPAEDDLLLVPLDQAGQQRRRSTALAFARSSAGIRSARSVTMARGVGKLMTAQAGVQHRAHVGDRVVVPGASGRSTVHCSTRPVSVISTSSSRCGASGTSSMCRTEDRDSDGYWTTATWRVSWASSRTVRMTTSSRL